VADADAGPGLATAPGHPPGSRLDVDELFPPGSASRSELVACLAQMLCEARSAGASGGAPAAPGRPPPTSDASPTGAGAQPIRSRRGSAA
jgi:hypothetical protein